MNDIEKLAEMIKAYEETSSEELGWINCSAAAEHRAKVLRQEFAASILDAGYLPVEPVEIEGLTLTEKDLVISAQRTAMDIKEPEWSFISKHQLEQLVRMQACKSYEAGVNATIDKIKQQGTIYRRVNRDGR